MKIHIYSIVRNDRYILPFFLRHYSTFADRIFIIDDHSTDDTAEIAKANSKVTLLPFEYNRGMNEDDFNDCLEKSYKKYSRGNADWVMCVDSDEFIYNKDIVFELAKQSINKNKVLRSEGYMMVSEKLPGGSGQIYDECKKGIRVKEYDKTVIFNPDIDITFGHGRHSTKYLAGVLPVDAGMLLLHYRYLSREYFIQRSTHLYERCNFDQKTRNYRMRRGLAWYENSLKSKLLINVI